MKYKIGDVITFKGKGFYNNCISLFNWIKYHQNKATHVGIISKIENGTVYVHESIQVSGKDFNAYPYEDYKLDNLIKEGTCYQLRPNEPIKNIVKFIKKYENTKYDWISILLMPFKLSVNSTKHVFCSEVVARILYDASNKKLNISAELGKSYEKIIPMDIYLSEQLNLQ